MSETAYRSWSGKYMFPFDDAAPAGPAIRVGGLAWAPVRATLARPGRSAADDLWPACTGSHPTARARTKRLSCACHTRPAPPRGLTSFSTSAVQVLTDRSCASHEDCACSKRAELNSQMISPVATRAMAPFDCWCRKKIADQPNSSPIGSPCCTRITGRPVFVRYSSR